VHIRRESCPILERLVDVSGVTISEPGGSLAEGSTLANILKINEK